MDISPSTMLVISSALSMLSLLASVLIAWRWCVDSGDCFTLVR